MNFAANTYAQWAALILQSNTNPPSYMEQLLVQILGALQGPTGQGGGALPVMNGMESMPIVNAGPNDTVDFTRFAGKIPVAVIGKVSATDFEAISAAPGYQLNPANDTDSVLLGSGGINISSLANSFNFNFSLTGAGTTAQWTSGRYSKVYIFYK